MIDRTRSPDPWQEARNVECVIQRSMMRALHILPDQLKRLFHADLLSNPSGLGKSLLKVLVRKPNWVSEPQSLALAGHLVPVEGPPTSPGDTMVMPAANEFAELQRRS